MLGTALRPSGLFTWSCRDPRGNLKWYGTLRNGVTVQGANEALNRMFRATPQTGWFTGLVDQSGFSAVDSADTNASHVGWAEFTGYAGTRPAWNPVAATSGFCATGAGSVFTITAGGTLRGTFLASVTATGLGVGVLYCTAIALVGGVVTVAPADTVTVTYVCRYTDGS